MKSTPRVSVIIPARDSGAHIGDCLTSLLHQGLAPEELEPIVINDGSTDQTADVAASFAPDLPRLQLLHNLDAGGVSAARNRGIAAATGDWLLFLDPDDWLFPHHLARATEIAAELDVDFTVCDQVQARGTHRWIVRAPEPRRNVVLDPRTGILPTYRSTMVNYVQVTSRLLSRRAVDQGLVHFDESLPTAEDREWAWRLLLSAGSYAVIDAPGYVYRREVQGSLTQIGDQRQIGFVDAYSRIHRLVGSAGNAQYAPKVLRDALAVFHHHISRKEAFSSEVWDLMCVRVRTLLAQFPREQLRSQLDEMGPARSAEILRHGYGVVAA